MYMASGLTRSGPVPAVVLMMGNPALASARVVYLDCEVEAQVDAVFAAWKRQVEGQRIIAEEAGSMLSVEWALPGEALRNLRTSLTLTFERRAGERTYMTLTHAGFGKGEAWDEALAWFAQGWPAVAAEMKVAVETAAG